MGYDDVNPYHAFEVLAHTKVQKLEASRGQDDAQTPAKYSWFFQHTDLKESEFSEFRVFEVGCYTNRRVQSLFRILSCLMNRSLDLCGIYNRLVEQVS